jgi:hypothetical protein
LETSAIPDRRPDLWVTVRVRSGTFAFTARCAEPLHHGHHGHVEAAGVPSSGIEPASPALQAGAITRSATRALLWPGWCPATGIVNYSIVKERIRCATKSFGDEDSNLDWQGQNLLAYRWPIPDWERVGTRTPIGRARIGQAWGGGESNPVRSGKNRVLRRQSFRSSQSHTRSPDEEQRSLLSCLKLTSRNEKSRRGFPGRLHRELSVVRA